MQRRTKNVRHWNAKGCHDSLPLMSMVTPSRFPERQKGFPNKVQKQSCCQRPAQPKRAWWTVAKSGEVQCGDVSCG